MKMHQMIVISPKELANLVSLCMGFVSKGSTLEILKNIYIGIKNGELILRATDMEKYIQITKKISNTETESSITVDVKKFLDCLRSINEAEVNISVEMEKNEVSIQTPKDNFELKGIPSSEYVSLPNISSDNNFSLYTKLLATGLNKTEFICNEKSFSPVFTGVCMYAKLEYVVFVSSDGQALFEYKVKISEELGYKPNIILPKSYCASLSNICSYVLSIQADNKTNIKITNNMVGIDFVQDDVLIQTSSVLIQGAFPDYSNPKVMPVEFNTTVNVKADILDKQIKKIGILSDDSKNICKIIISDNKFTVRAINAKAGRGDTYVDVNQVGNDIELAVAGKYINDYIRSSSAENIELKLVNESMSFIIANPDDVDYIAIARPMKI